MTAPVWSVALCLFKNVTPTDYQVPLEMMTRLWRDAIHYEMLQPPPAVNLTITFLAETMEPVVAASGPHLILTTTYAAALDKQFDVLMVPGGWATQAEELPQALHDFVKKQYAGAKYILSICTGAEILAHSGAFDGKTASDTYSDRGITWVPKARWVVDGNLWTSSGVTAGGDMAYAWLNHILGNEMAEQIRINVESSIASGATI
ncbi:class I glutamine amidotransferase-like protein [Trametopsis cervina]|nr:class I glutamine amidotransferase-like protein [Trametopsis cervina]